MADRPIILLKLGSAALKSNAVMVADKGKLDLIAGAERERIAEMVPLRPGMIDAIIRASALNVITERWQGLGGTDGALGARIAPLRTEGTTFIQNYRGGRIELREGVLQAVQQHRLRVRYAGMHCFGAQSGPGDDDMYAFVNAYAPEQAGRTPTAIKIPRQGDGTIAMDSGRSSTADIGEIWSGPPQDMLISSVLFEQDSGFPADQKRYVDGALAAGAAAIGGLLGGPGGAALGGGLAAAFAPAFTSWVASEILGLDDDSFGTHVREVSYHEQMGALPVHSEHGLQFTHQSELLSDGDGSYKLYFQVIREDITTTL